MMTGTALCYTRRGSAQDWECDLTDRLSLLADTNIDRQKSERIAIELPNSGLADRSHRNSGLRSSLAVAV
jgi:hypothetical protein